MIQLITNLKDKTYTYVYRFEILYEYILVKYILFNYFNTVSKAVIITRLMFIMLYIYNIGWLVGR